MPELPRPQPRAVRLDFRRGARAPANLSGVAACDDALFVAGDEGCGVTLLRSAAPAGGEALRYEESAYFPLHELLDLPDGDDVEADLEGLCACDGWLWLAGSHSLKRKDAEAHRDDADNARRLATLELEGNRLLLARVPIERDADGTPRLVHEAADGRRAMRLRGGARRNALTRLLAEDPHLGPSLAWPGKDNGFDVEGLAVAGDRVLLGLRGPVLRGWSLVLELSLREGRRRLKPARVDGDGPRLRKHVLQLDGLGVRDLHWRGDDLYLLAGPTMVLDGEIRLYRWPAARQHLTTPREPLRFDRTPQAIATLPHAPGGDRAEALCALPDGRWLVLYDSPARDRLQGASVYGDLLAPQALR